MKIGHILLLAWAVFAATTGSAGAFDQSETGMASSRLTLNGFGTLGIARSDNDQTQYVRDLSQPHGLTTNGSGSRAKIILDLER